jgi:hypothetical protein
MSPCRAIALAKAGPLFSVLYLPMRIKTGGQRHNVEQENGWTDVQAEP